MKPLLEIEHLDIPEKYRNEINHSIENYILQLEDNHAEINELTMQAVPLILTNQARIKEQQEQGKIRAFLNKINGKNNKSNLQVLADTQAAVYAARQCMNYLSQQNKLTVDLIAAVNNRLLSFASTVEQDFSDYQTILASIDKDVIGLSEEVPKIKSGLQHHSLLLDNNTHHINEMQKFCEDIKENLIRMELKIDKMEQDIRLLQWSNAISHLKYNGVLYSELDNVSKLICVVNDFFTFTNGEWNQIQLLQLQSTLEKLDLKVYDQISIATFLRQIIKEPDLLERLLHNSDKEKLNCTTFNELPLLISLQQCSQLKYFYGKFDFLFPKELIELVYADVSYELLRNANINTQSEITYLDLALDLLNSLNVLMTKQGTQMIVQDMHSILSTKLKNGDFYSVSSKEYEHLLLNYPQYERVITLDRLIEITYYIEHPRITLNVASALFEIHKEDEYSAYREFEKLLNKNHSYAQYWFGQYLENKEKDGAFEFIALSAQQGFINAQCLLGVYYKDGTNIEENMDLSKYWLKKAINQGHIGARVELGLIFVNEQNWEKAFKLLSSAAKNDRDYAYHALSSLYFYEESPYHDFEKCKELLLKAAKFNNPDAYFSLGSLYSHESYDKKDYKKAIMYYEKAGELGYLVDDELADIYIMEEDFEKAFEHYNLSYEAGSLGAKYMVGCMLVEGIGVEQDESNGSYLLYQAALNGHEGAIEEINTDKPIYKLYQEFLKKI